jgi:hypothetical protein
MAITVYPATQTDNWIQIATSTPTSGTVVSFTSISTAYRKLWLVTGKDPITATGAAYFSVTVNSLTGTNDYTYFSATATTSTSRYDDENAIYQSVNTATLYAFDLTFENKTSATPSATFKGSLGAGNSGRTISSGRIPALTSAITQIDLTLSANAISGASTGTLTLYGTY